MRVRRNECGDFRGLDSNSWGRCHRDYCGTHRICESLCRRIRMSLSNPKTGAVGVNCMILNIQIKLAGFYSNMWD